MISTDYEIPTGAKWWIPIRDLTARVQESDWLRSVADRRIKDLDGIRSYLTRLLLTVIVIACLLLCRWGGGAVAVWTWPMLVFPLAQVYFEIRLHLRVWRRTELERADPGSLAGADSTGTVEGPTGPPTRPTRNRIDYAMVKFWQNNYEKRPFNVTGLIGAIAVPALLIDVAFGVVPIDRYAWIKVTAFAAAVLYANSGLGGPLLEATVYSDKQFGPLLRLLRPFVWMALTVATAALVFWSARADRWSSDSLPYAYLACALTCGLGLRIREHDRVAGAASLLVRDANADAARRIANELHDLVQAHKSSLGAAIALDGLGPANRIELESLRDSMAHLHKRAQQRDIALEDSLLPDARTQLEEISRPMANDAHFDVDVLLPGSGIHPEQSAFAKRLASTLVHNVVQEYGRRPQVSERRLAVVAALDGSMIRLTVEDGLGLVPREKWESASTIGHFRREVCHDRGGTFEQRATPCGKVIEAVWPNTFRPLLQQHDDEL